MPLGGRSSPTAGAQNHVCSGEIRMCVEADCLARNLFGFDSIPYVHVCQRVEEVDIRPNEAATHPSK